MNFKEIKELFRDKIDTNLYVPLAQKAEIDLTYAIREKEKIILVYGDAGSGKSFLIRKTYEYMVKNEKELKPFFIANPFEDADALEEFFFVLDPDVHSVVFIDEAQVLSEDKIERLRMLSDSGNYTIVLATHESEVKKVFSKKHFQTRINYFIKLMPLDLEKIELFITHKLIEHDMYNIVSLFRKSNYKLIYKYTKGNLREINRLMYKTFDIIEYFRVKYPHKVSTSKLQNKYIEMADMDLKDTYA